MDQFAKFRGSQRQIIHKVIDFVRPLNPTKYAVFGLQIFFVYVCVCHVVKIGVDVGVCGYSKLRQGDKFTSSIYSGATADQLQTTGPPRL